MEAWLTFLIGLMAFWILCSLLEWSLEGYKRSGNWSLVKIVGNTFVFFGKSARFISDTFFYKPKGIDLEIQQEKKEIEKIELHLNKIEELKRLKSRKEMLFSQVEMEENRQWR